MRYAGKLAELQMGDGAPTEVFTKIAQVRSIAWGGFTQNVESAVDNDSTEQAEEHVETTKDYGTVTIECHYDPAETTQGTTDAGLLGRFIAGGIRNYRVVDPPGVAGGLTAEFAASVNVNPGTRAVDGKIMIIAEFKVSGVVTFT